MPQFEPRKKGGETPPQLPALRETQIVESRCHVCQHEQRHAIDRLIAIGTSHSEIERLFAVGRRSVATHAKAHLGYEDAAVREIVSREATKIQENIEDGISAMVNQRLYLEVALQRALDQILGGSVDVLPKDAVAIIELMRKLDTEQSSAGIETYRAQFGTIMQAIMEVAPPELWEKIKDRAGELWAAERKRNPQIEPPQEL